MDASDVGNERTGPDAGWQVSGARPGNRSGGSTAADLPSTTAMEPWMPRYVWWTRWYFRVVLRCNTQLVDTLFVLQPLVTHRGRSGFPGEEVDCIHRLLYYQSYVFHCIWDAPHIHETAGIPTYRVWYQQGVLHRVGGPAVEYLDDKGIPLEESHQQFWERGIPVKK